MTLSTQQVKEARSLAKSLGLNTKLVNKDLGNGFWMEECKGSFEGYLEYVKGGFGNFDGSSMMKSFEQSTARYRAEKSGAASL